MRHDDWSMARSFDKDERRILSWSDDNTLRLWDAATGKQIGPAMKHDGPVNGAIVRQGRTAHPVVVSRQDAAAVGRRDRPADRPGDEARRSVKGASFDKDERRILSWSDDNTLRLWDAATGQQIGPAMKHDDSV